MQVLNRERFAEDLRSLNREGHSRTDTLYSFLEEQELLNDFSSYVKRILKEDKNENFN